MKLETRWDAIKVLLAFALGPHDRRMLYVELLGAAAAVIGIAMLAGIAIALIVGGVATVLAVERQ